MSIIIKLRIFITPSPLFIRYKSKFSQSNLRKLLETMPKETNHIAEAQKQRIKIKEKQSKYVPGKVMVQVLGSGSEGAPKALYMFTDNARYLFNCGEGTQRLAHEHKMKLSKLEHIFITEPSWKNIGGLPGVSLTIQDVGVPQINLHGPDGLDELFTATRRFVVLRDLKIQMADCKVENKYEDNVMCVNYVPIVKSKEPYVDEEEIQLMKCKESSVQVKAETSDAFTSTRSERKRNRSRSRSRVRQINQEDDVDYYAHEQSGVREKIAPLPPMFQQTREHNTVMNYICRLHPRPGALDVAACAEKKVPPGPLMGQLKSGKDIVLPDGTVVQSKDVCFPDDPGPVMLIVDCPSVEYLNSFIREPAFKKHQSSANCDNDLAYLVVHFTPAKIFKKPKYQEWIDKFSPSTHHLILNDANGCMGSAAVHRIQYQLNLLSNEIFPLLANKGMKILTETSSGKKIKLDLGQNISLESKMVEDVSSKEASLQNVILEENTLESTKNQAVDGINILTPGNNEQVTNGMSVKSTVSTPESNFIQPGTLCKFHLRPKKGIDRESELVLDPAQYIQEVMSVEGFERTLNETKSIVEEERQKHFIADYPKVLFLGTGSCIPNKTRNVSSILVQTSEYCNILLDCGEGTYGQIVRFFGRDNYKEVIRNIKAVYISHLHADHHLGLVGLILERRRTLESMGLSVDPILLCAPQQILSWLTFYHRRFQKIDRDFEIISNVDLLPNARKLTLEEQHWVDNIEMSKIQMCQVRHCPNAFGVRLNHKDGWSITYSGDTMPSDNLIDLGNKTDLLIHEATMEDDLALEAIHKMHSTTSQAINAGRVMLARHIMLTHFSQRYAKLPRFSNNLTSGNICIAFDNMHVRLGDLKLLPLMYPALKLMFSEHHDELENKAHKRQLKAEREAASYPFKENYVYQKKA